MRKSVLIPDCAGIIIGQIPRGVFFNTHRFRHGIKLLFGNTG